MHNWTWGKGVLMQSGIVSIVADDGIRRWTGTTNKIHAWYNKYGSGDGALRMLTDGGPALNAILSSPDAVFVDRVGNIYFPDAARVRKVDPSGIINTIAGTGVAGYSGDGGLATNAQMKRPFGVYVDPAGNIYIGSSGDNRIRKINPSGIISTFAGNGTNGYTGDGGPATNASIAGLQGITGDAAGIFTLLIFIMAPLSEK